ncbi:MAG: GcrA cell cycle regulator [Pseudomonadota bacterium]|nr:GcrA cell cycle regulator [Pseudomonadota bacterium]
MSWTDDRVEVLKKLWLEGLSASQIAKQLGGVTRNAVIGKVHRLGLSGRATPSQPARVARAPRPPRPVSQPTVRREAAAPAHPRPEPQRFYAPEEPGTATVLTLGAHMCKWPIGDPSSDEFTFCGRRAEGAYCVEHSRVAFQPPQTKKKNTTAELVRSLRRYI